MGIQGIIRPPSDIRAVADKTASFVAKNGRAFETRIMNSAKGKTPKFAFLHESSPFHAYYEDRIVFFQNGGSAEDKADEKKDVDKDTTTSKPTAEVQGKSDGEDDTQKGTSTTRPDESKEKDSKEHDENKAESTAITSTNAISARKVTSVSDPIARALLAERTKIANFSSEDSKNSGEPPAPLFSLFYTTPIAPKSITTSQLELIKLTAQFVALSGKGGSFLRDITLREWNNPTTFGFLQPRHGHFAYFSHLVDIYRHLLAKSVCVHEENEQSKQAQGKQETEEKDVKKTSLLTLTSVKKMVGLDLSQQATTDAVDDNKSDEISTKIARETKFLHHTADSVSNCLQVVAHSVEYDRYQKEKKRKELEDLQGSSQGGLNAAAKVDWYDFVVVETIEFPVDEVVEMLPPPPPPLPPAPASAPTPAPITNDEMDESSDESGDEEGLNVVTHYEPNVVPTQSTLESADRTHVIDPITKKSIPIKDMTEHMRIQLLDPKWGAEKKKFLEKQKESNFVQGEMIARNVDAFAKARGDLFGSASDKLDNREESQKRLEEANRVLREQVQQPERAKDESATSTVVDVTPPPPPPPPSTLNQAGQYTAISPTNQIHHQKPDMLLPDAKRVKTDPTTSFSAQDPQQSNAGSLPIPPPPAPLPPPPTNNVLQPPPIPMPAAPPVESEQKADNEDTTIIPTILSEEDFIQSLSDPNITLSIIVPNQDATNSALSSWNFNGQTISITVDVRTKIKAIKQQIQSQLGGMPVNKMQLKSPSTGFLKDASSLAFLNIGPNYEPLQLVPKVRGGRK